MHLTCTWLETSLTLRLRVRWFESDFSIFSSKSGNNSDEPAKHVSVYGGCYCTFEHVWSTVLLSRENLNSFFCWKKRAKKVTFLPLAFWRNSNDAHWRCTYTVHTSNCHAMRIAHADPVSLSVPIYLKSQKWRPSLSLRTCIDAAPITPHSSLHTTLIPTQLEDSSSLSPLSRAR
jgi:hypothetical protein